MLPVYFSVAVSADENAKNAPVVDGRPVEKGKTVTIEEAAALKVGETTLQVARGST